MSSRGLGITGYDMNPRAAERLGLHIAYVSLNIHDPLICKHFGCGKHLTNIEQLAGDYCTNHMKKNIINPTDFISY